MFKDSCTSYSHLLITNSSVQSRIYFGRQILTIEILCGIHYFTWLWFGWVISQSSNLILSNTDQLFCSHFTSLQIRSHWHAFFFLHFIHISSSVNVDLFSFMSSIKNKELKINKAILINDKVIYWFLPNVEFRHKIVGRGNTVEICVKQYRLEDNHSYSPPMNYWVRLYSINSVYMQLPTYDKE